MSITYNTVFVNIFTIEFKYASLVKLIGKLNNNIISIRVFSPLNPFSICACFPPNLVVRTY